MLWKPYKSIRSAEVRFAFDRGARRESARSLCHQPHSLSISCRVPMTMTEPIPHAATSPRSRCAQCRLLPLSIVTVAERVRQSDSSKWMRTKQRAKKQCRNGSIQ